LRDVEVYTVVLMIIQVLMGCHIVQTILGTGLVLCVVRTKFL